MEGRGLDDPESTFGCSSAHEQHGDEREKWSEHGEEQPGAV
jgi:hypothetical protein